MSAFLYLCGMKIITYNVNGIRAAVQKGFLEWLENTGADVVCLQEIKALHEQLPLLELSALGYEVYTYPAQKKGYSGVAMLTKIKPDRVVLGMQHAQHDAEGRVLRADFGDLSVLSVYFPSGSSGEDRQAVKMQFLADFSLYVENLKKERPYLVLSGDYNICHKAIDIHNPISNKNSSGFLPEERAWVDSFLAQGFVDTFRYFHADLAHQYTWWSYRANARAKNLGWRIDYHLVSANLQEKLLFCQILPDALHADHCPVLLALNI